MTDTAPALPATDVVVVATDPLWSAGFVDAHRDTHRVRAHDSLPAALEVIGDRPTVVVVREPDPLATIEAVRALAVEQPAVAIVLVAPSLDVDLLRAAMLAGISDVVEDARSGDASLWREVVDTSARLAARTAPVEREPGRIVLCTAAAGSQGTSLIAANLAIALSRAGRRVVLLEGDHRFGDVREIMGLLGSRPGGPTVDRRFSSTWLAPYMHRHQPSGVTVMLPPLEFTTIEDFPPTMVVEALGQLQSRADTIVVDAPFWVTETYKFPVWSDLTLLITRDAPRHLAKARNAGRVLKPYDATTRLVIANYVDGRTPKRKDLAKTIGFDTIGRIPETEGLDRSIEQGTPIVLDTPDSPYAVAVTELAGAVLEWSGPPPGPGAPTSA